MTTAENGPMQIKTFFIQLLITFEQFWKAATFSFPKLCLVCVVNCFKRYWLSKLPHLTISTPNFQTAGFSGPIMILKNLITGCLLINYIINARSFKNECNYGTQKFKAQLNKIPSMFFKHYQNQQKLFDQNNICE